MKRLLRSSVLLLLLWSLAAFSAQAQVVTITAAQLQNGQAVELDQLGWKYSPNDDPRFADPQFDDSAWESLHTTVITPDNLPNSGWHGVAWFRLRLRVAPELADLALNLEMTHLGASTIYLNGKQIGLFGVVGKILSEETPYNPNASPLGLIFQPVTEQVLTIRYSNLRVANLNTILNQSMTRRARNDGGAGFRSRITRLGSSANQGFRRDLAGIRYSLFQGTVFLSFGVLYLLLFAFFPRLRANLIFSIFLFGVGMNNMFLMWRMIAHVGQPAHYFLQIATTVLGDSLANMSLLAFLYVVFYRRILRRFWIFLLVGLLDIVTTLFALEPYSAWVYSFYNLAFALELVRVVIIAIWQKLPGAIIIGVGVLAFSLLHLRELLNYIVPLPFSGYIALDAIAFFGGMLAFSIYLAREFAHTNKNLETQLIQVKQLSAAALEHEKIKAENERRAKELEEAHQLQLSMLPKKLPALPHLDIAAFMKTATEVGGDYYDFHTSDDGTLTIAVGDATGHGLKAGTMVTAVKSLFETLAYHPDIPHIFERWSRTLKRMNLRGLFMAMTMVKVKDHQLTMSMAGMPPVLLYRAAAGAIEEVLMKALPLGGITKYQYQQQELTLAPGDVIVLMSDGLPERMNAAGEMLDYEATRRAFADAAQHSSQQIIEALVRAGDDWAQGKAQDDDVTFVVVKVRRSTEFVV